MYNNNFHTVKTIDVVLRKLERLKYPEVQGLI